MKKIKYVARIILEVVGSPKEHVEETLKDVLKKLSTEEEIRVAKEMFYEAEELPSKLWSTFAEVEFETTSLKRLVEICFDYMPANLEIIEPAGMEMDSTELGTMFTELLAKLHRYAMAIKNLQAENILLKHKYEKK
ncbi:hypothetical protein HY501_01180 [Candidatus Woesearchaeota archaeon]|nr:hypothetical protein [Candidatus Woesearchaeota archaeon]